MVLKQNTTCESKGIGTPWEYKGFSIKVKIKLIEDVPFALDRDREI
jgi:hypothetical protein